MWQSALSLLHAVAVATGLSSSPTAPTPAPAPVVDATVSESHVATATPVNAAPETTAPVHMAPIAAAPFAAAPVAAAPVKVAAAGGKTAADLATVVASMQKTYEATKDFSADFTQKYTYTLLRRTQESTGKVKFKKGGHMRWDYTAPVPKKFVVDGSSLWIHTPSDKTAIVNRCFKQDGLTASVSFLWGAGDIDKEFNASWFAGQFGGKTDHHIQLLPKKTNTVFAKLILVLDPKTFRVKQSIVVDTQGNVNQFLYKDLKFNQGLKDGAFKFVPPKATHVSTMPGSCAEAEKPKK